MQKWEYCELGWDEKEEELIVYTFDMTKEGNYQKETLVKLEWGGLTLERAYSTIRKYLASFGEHGWELVTVTKETVFDLVVPRMYFKRPLAG